MLGIVVYAIGGWEGFHRRPMLEALARNLRGRGFLLIVEPPVALLDAGQLRDWRPGARAVLRPTEQRAENLWVARPTVAREGRGEVQAYARSVRQALGRIGPRADRVAALVFRPEQSRLLGAAGEDSVIYECYDEYRVDMYGRDLPGVAEAERTLLAAARIVLTTSQPLHESRAAEHSSVYYTPNGVDYELFQRARDPGLEVAEEVRDLTAPVVGYVGNFTDFLDFEGIEGVVRSCPDLSFVFVGPVSAREVARRLQAIPNTRFLGPRPRSQLPAYLKRMACALCLLRPNAFSRCQRPLTVMEYLAAGVPTVVRPSPSLDDLGEVLYFANDAEEAGAALHRALEEDGEERRDRRQERAREYDWDVLTKRSAEILLECCG
jgi:glycosyltransferase involved in cell wall biosynthesis